MRGRSCQGSDRTGRAHPLTLLRFQMVPENMKTALVRGSLRGPRLQLKTLILKFHVFILSHLFIFSLIYLNVRVTSRSRSSVPSPRSSATGPRRLSISGGNLRP